jgi:holin-like protein
MSEWRGTALNVIAQLGIIFGICLISEGISALLPFAMPASIIGMLLLLLMLILKIVKTEQIRSVTDFLIGNLPFFFVPAVVGLINYLDILSANAVKMVLVVFVSMAATFAATMWAVRLTIRLMERGKK